MIPDGLGMAVGFVIGVVVGTIGTASIAAVRAMEVRRIIERGAFIRGRNYERVGHGEDVLVPPPELDEPELWRYGVGA